MLNVDKLPKSMVENIARNMGYDSGKDFEQYKKQISQMDEVDALRCYCAWHLGNYEWADFFLEAQEDLRKAKI